MSITSISATHDNLAGASLGTTLVYLVDADFGLTQNNPTGIITVGSFPINFQAFNSTLDTFNNVTVDIISHDNIILNPDAPVQIGTMGPQTAAPFAYGMQGEPGSAGTVNNVVARIRGERNGELYENTMTFAVTVN